MDNPKPPAELSLLQQYGPDVPDATLQKLVAVFGELRSMADQGTISYPYSVREVVSIVKHLQVTVIHSFIIARLVTPWLFPPAFSHFSCIFFLFSFVLL